MNAYDKIRAALEFSLRQWPKSKLIGDALVALADQEKSAAEPLFILTTGAIDGDGEQDDWDIECESSRRLESFCAARPGSTVKLYAAAPVAEIREVVVTDEVSMRAWEHMIYRVARAPASIARDWLNAWRAELGPALGLVEIREPTDDECRDIWREAKANEGDGSKVCAGRAMFDACRAVMWPKEGL